MQYMTPHVGVMTGSSVIEFWGVCSWRGTALCGCLFGHRTEAVPRQHAASCESLNTELQYHHTSFGPTKKIESRLSRQNPLILANTDNSAIISPEVQGLEENSVNDYIMDNVMVLLYLIAVFTQMRAMWYDRTMHSRVAKPLHLNSHLAWKGWEGTSSSTEGISRMFDQDKFGRLGHV